MSKKQITNTIEIEKFVRDFQEKVRVKLNEYDEVLSEIIEGELEKILDTKSMMEIKSSVFAYYLVLGLLFEKMKVTAIETGIAKDVLEEQMTELKSKDIHFTDSYLSIRSKNKGEELELEEDEHKIEEDEEDIYDDVALLSITSKANERN